jgi:hypothetical protein
VINPKRYAPCACGRTRLLRNAECAECRKRARRREAPRVPAVCRGCGADHLARPGEHAVCRRCRRRKHPNPAARTRRHVGATPREWTERPEWRAHLDRLAERAAAGLPLFGEGT